jgi:hypothetical protein
MKQLISVLLVIWAFSIAGMSQTGTPTKGGPLNDDQKGQQLPAGLDYVIGPGDVLSIVVLGEDQLSTKVTVRADGKISLLLLDENSGRWTDHRSVEGNDHSRTKKVLDRSERVRQSR